MNAEALKKLIIRSLRKQGFQVNSNGRVTTLAGSNKEHIRGLHAEAVLHQIDKGRGKLAPKEAKLIEYVANGSEIVPELVSPRLVEAKSDTFEGALFRYAALHWSIPISTGYGRRLRFLVMDEQNDKLIGLIGLADPVFNLGVRDKWIGWDKQAQQSNLSHVMDAFVLGAVPPYSQLLCGKLVAMLVASKEVREAFKRKYCGQQSLISQRELDARLALITTTSALGRSSIYNRLKYCDNLLYQPIGFTQGYGEFHFTNGVYWAISEYASAHALPTARHASWGNGFRNRREVVRKCLSSLGIKSDWTYHGIQREVFVVPLAHNTQAFLRGEHTRLRGTDYSVSDLAAFFKERWLLPRSQRDQSYEAWNRNQWRLWPEE